MNAAVRVQVAGAQVESAARTNCRLQRNCACGATAQSGDCKCEECRTKDEPHLHRKLAISASGNHYKRETGRKVLLRDITHILKERDLQALTDKDVDSLPIAVDRYSNVDISR